VQKGVRLALLRDASTAQKFEALVGLRGLINPAPGATEKHSAPGRDKRLAQWGGRGGDCRAFWKPLWRSPSKLRARLRRVRPPFGTAIISTDRRTAKPKMPEARHRAGARAWPYSSWRADWALRGHDSLDVADAEIERRGGRLAWNDRPADG
jgi:hypothetical protein